MQAADMLSKRSLGDQLDAWCEMLAAASAAVSAGPGGRHLRPPGSAAPSPPTGVPVTAPSSMCGLSSPTASRMQIMPRPPDVPRSTPRAGARDSPGGFVLSPGQLTELTLPNTHQTANISNKPPVGPPPFPSGRTSRVVRRKSINVKKPSSVSPAKEETRKKQRTKGKGRTRSRTQSHPTNRLSSRSDSWTNVSSIGKAVSSSERLITSAGVPGATSEGTSRASLLSRQQSNDIAPSLLNSSIISTTQVSDSESGLSESDKSDDEETVGCRDKEDASPLNPVSSPIRARNNNPSNSTVGLNRATEMSACNFRCVSTNAFSPDGAGMDINHTSEVTKRLPPKSYRSGHSQYETRSKPLGVHTGLSQSMSNLTKLPEVHRSFSQERLNVDPVSPPQHTPTVRHSRAKGKIISPQHDEQKPKKKGTKPSIISLVKPINQETEKAKFLASRNYEYNPQFQYKNAIDPSAYKKYFKPEYKLMPLALKVMQNVLMKHGSYEKYAKKSGGRELSKEEIMVLVNNYLKGEGLEDEVAVKLSSDLVSRACMTRVKGRPLLQVQTNNVHEGWMDGLLRHELGTHYLRSCNNRCQQWRRRRKRREYEMDHQNPTEEGLASLHSVIFREDPCLWRAAMLYYTVARASDLSFSALFHDLGKFAKDPNVRWDYCLRAKRGFSNTADPGAFTKDQVYLKGALEILKRRRAIDFHALVRLGKISYKDVDRLVTAGAATYHQTRIPRFMRDLDYYHKKLDEILYKNGLDDADLATVS